MKNENPFIWEQKDEKNINKIVLFFDDTFTEKYLIEYRNGAYPEFYEIEALFELRKNNFYSNGAINVIFNYCLKREIPTNLLNILKITEDWIKEFKFVRKISTRHALQLIREFDEKNQK